MSMRCNMMQSRKEFNIHFRQLVHVGYKVAAEMGERFQRFLGECRATHRS